MNKKKFTKEEIYKNLKGEEVPTLRTPLGSTLKISSRAPIREELQKQLESNYKTGALYNRILDPHNWEPYLDSEIIAEKERRKAANEFLKKLADDMQINDINFGKQSFQNYFKKPTYLHKGESYDIDELPKESNPTSLTSFLGSFDPFKTEAPLTEKDRSDDSIYYEPQISGDESNRAAQALIGLGLAKDFRTGRIAPKLQDENLMDERLKAAKYLNISPETLDEMVETSIGNTDRFNKIKQRMK